MIKVSEILDVQKDKLLQNLQECADAGSKASATVKPIIDEMKRELKELKNTKEDN